MKSLSNVFLTLLFAGLTTSLTIKAQIVEEPIDTLPGVIEKLQSDVELLGRIKVSGLVQAQWQKADTIGSPASASGGDFKESNNRFQLRRARLKVAYTGELQLSNVVLQLDLKDDGSVKVKEAYGSLTDPYIRFFTLSGGFMNRPLGFETGYSSGSLESPERARIMQTLFPDEVDMGMQLTIQAPKTSPWHFLKLEAGLFNGNAIASDNDKFKDFISRFSIKKSTIDENISVIAGLSYYNGGYANQSGAVYTLTDKTYLQDTSYKKYDKVNRQYMGFDLQTSISSLLGLTIIRGEFYTGKQPGTRKSSVSPKGAMTESKNIVVADTNGKPYTVTTTIGSDIYLRNFSGGYIMFTQHLFQTKHELVVKYDFYDPNKKLSKNEITNIGDIRFSTLGLGWNYYVAANLKLTAYYEMITNERTNHITGKGTGTDDYSKNLKDNVLTVRLQYKF